MNGKIWRREETVTGVTKVEKKKGREKVTRVSRGKGREEQRELEGL